MRVALNGFLKGEMKCLMHVCELTAALPEDSGATEFVESFSIETRSVN